MPQIDVSTAGPAPAVGRAEAVGGRRIGPRGPQAFPASAPGVAQPGLPEASRRQHLRLRSARRTQRLGHRIRTGNTLRVLLLHIHLNIVYQITIR